MLFRSDRRLSLLFLPILLATMVTGATSALAQKSVRKSFVSEPLTLSLTAGSAVVSACPADASRVQLNAKAYSPRGHTVRYRWSTSAGRIDGDGPAVWW